MHLSGVIVPTGDSPADAVFPFNYLFLELSPPVVYLSLVEVWGFAWCWHQLCHKVQ